MREATQRLLELGLTDKEASTYLAMLELGPSSVQDIAKKSGVQRTTVYDILKDLQQRGLASTTEQGSKTVYTAESPTSLQSFLERQGQEIEQRQKKMEESLPFFMAMYNSLADKPRVRYFEGEKCATSIREIMMDSRGEYLSFTAIDEDLLNRASKVDEPQRLRMSRRMHGKYIYALKPGCEQPKMDLANWDVRQIPYESAPFKGEINIVDAKVGVYVNTSTSSIGFIVESRELADLFRALFMTAWQSAKPVKKET